MRKQVLSFIMLLAVLSLLLTACGAPAATQPPATQSPAQPTAAPQATEAPKATEAPQPTEPPQATTASAGQKPVEIRWYIRCFPK